MSSNENALERLSAALADRYVVGEVVGAGGMATVYSAQDLKHDRKVALKVLHTDLAAVMGPERFLAEIRTTANLAHSHILPLFDSGEAEGFLFYVMPLVEGESLQQRLDREGQLPVEEAVAIAGHVADALEYAHGQGVIHRDIKPANILFRGSNPVVTDFGIALAVTHAGEGRLTDTGLSLGTPYYMSPEQAAGDQEATAASDVYSLGSVLYEMLTGDPPHTGSSAQAILGKILLADVTPPTKLRRTIPANVEGALLKALERVPADRFTSAADLGRALLDKGFRHGIGADEAKADVPGRWRMGTLVAGFVAVLALVAGFTGILGPKPQPALVVRTPMPEVPARPWGNVLALAPDGSGIVAADPTPGSGLAPPLTYKPRGSESFTPIQGTEGARFPTFSPEGHWIIYRLGPDIIRRPPVGGGAERLAQDASATARGLSWLDDGTILYEQEGGTVVRIPEDGGGIPDTVFVFGDDLEGGNRVLHIEGLPGSEAALATTCLWGNCLATASLSVMDLREDTTWVLLEGVMRAWYAPTGHLVWVTQEGSVRGGAFNLKTLELDTRHRPLFDGVRTGTYQAGMEVGADGTVVYVEERSEEGPLYEVVWVDRTGRSELVDPGWPSDKFRTPALSPDDEKLALNIFTGGTDADRVGQVWVKELPNGPLTPLTTHQGLSRRPVWSLDMDTIAYTVGDGADTYLRTTRSDGRDMGGSEVLLDRDRSVYEIVFTPDGRGAIVREGSAAFGSADLGYLDLATGTVEEGVLATEFNERQIALSPDGRWLAYTSNHTGQDEVFVLPFPDWRSGLVHVSTNGGTEPVWGHNGRELFFRDRDGWMVAASYTADSTFRVESRDQLFDASIYRAAEGWREYDVDSADERFLMFRRVGGNEEGDALLPMILIQNWFTEVEEKMGGGNTRR